MITPKEYLQSLIEGMEMGSSIPVQLSELKCLQALMAANDKKSTIYSDMNPGRDYLDGPMIKMFRDE
jgi:hypothetical protein